MRQRKLKTLQFITLKLQVISIANLNTSFHMSMSQLNMQWILLDSRVTNFGNSMDIMLI
jgi:hypothetical protein